MALDRVIGVKSHDGWISPTYLLTYTYECASCVVVVEVEICTERAAVSPTVVFILETNLKDDLN